jgi:hypothetical protein
MGARRSSFTGGTEMTRIPIRFSAIAAGLLASLGVAGAMAVASDPPTERERIAAVAPGLADLVPAFARQQRESDKLPDDAMQALETFDDSQPGEDPSLSRRLAFSSGREAFVWPRANGVCYTTVTGAGCVPSALLARRGVVLAVSFSSESPVVQVFGLAEPGIDRVEFRLKGRSEPIVAKVTAGAFDIELPSDPVRASWTNPDGSPGSQDRLVPRP